jgi:hypothetical protein
MCDPVSITMVAMTALSATAGQQQARQGAKAQTRMYEANNANANKAVVDAYQQNQTRAFQEKAAASDAIQQRRLEETKQLSTGRVAAGEAGITGLSVDALLAEISGNAGRDVSTVDQNLDWTLDQLSNQQKGAQSQAQSQINSMAPGSKPSGWSAALQIGQGAVAGYGHHQKTTGKDPIGDWWAKK